MAATQLPAIGSTVCNNHVDGTDDHNLPSIAQRNDASTGYEVGDYDDFVSMANIVFSAMRLQAIAGSRCTFVGSTASSFTFNTPEGRVEIGDTVEVFHSQLVGGYRHSWWVTATVKNQITVDAASIRYPTTAISTMTYNADISVGDLVAVRTLGSGTNYAPNQIGIEQLITNLDAESAVKAANIYFGAGQTVEDELADHTTRMNTSMDVGGALKAASVAITNIDTAAMEDEGYAPLTPNGGMELWNAGTANAPAFYTAYNAAVEQSTDAKSGDFAAKVTVTGNSQGMYIDVPNYEAHKGKKIAAALYAKLASGTGQAQIMVYDGITYQQGGGVVLTSTYGEVRCSATVSAAATMLRIYILSVGVGAFSYLVDELAAYNGVLFKGYAPYTTSDAADDVRPHQLLMNSGFYRANNGTLTTEAPDAWAKKGSPVIGFSPDIGEIQLIELSAGGIEQDIGAIDLVADMLEGETVTFSVKLNPSITALHNIWVELEDDGGVTNIEIDPQSCLDGVKCWVTRELAATLTKVVARVYHLTSGGTEYIRVSQACLNIGSRPAPWTGENPSIWNPVSYTWAFDGTVSSFPTQESSPVFVMPADMYPLGISAYWETGAQGSFPFATLEHILRKISDGGSWGDAGIQLDYLTTAAIPGDQIIAMANTSMTAIQNAKIDYNEAIAMQIDQTAGFTGNPKEGTVTLWGYTITL